MRHNLSFILAGVAALLLTTLGWGLPPAQAQEQVVWVRGYPERGVSGCVDYVAQWSDGTYTATPWDCGAGWLPSRGSVTGSRGYPQIAANGCTEYVTQWSDGTYSWVPFSCPPSVVYAKPPEAFEPAVARVPAPANERSTALSVSRFERGHMIWREDNRTIYVVYDDGTWKSYPDTFGPGDPETTGQVPPAGRYEPTRGFGKVWRQNQDVRDKIGWMAAPEQGLTGRVSDSGGTTTIDALGLGRWILRPDGTYQKVR